MTGTQPSFDVAIVGGGPAGTSAARALASAGLRVVVLERSRYEKPRHGETLSPSARRALESLGIDARFRGDHAWSAGMVSIWGSPEPDVRSAAGDPSSGGLRLDRRRFDAALARAAEERGATVLLGSRLAELRRSPGGGWELFACSDGTRSVHFCSRFLVDATGRFSSLASRVGSATHTVDRLVGVVGTLSVEDAALSFDARVLVEAARDGWWYSAILPDGRLLAALMTDGDLVQAHDGPAGAWRSALDTAPHTRERLTRCVHPRDLRVVAAQTTFRDRVTGPGWLAAGDAALGLDPLSGLGITKALESGLFAASAIAAHLAGHGDAPLDRYAAWTQEDRHRQLAERARHYAGETRWRESPFWARRHTDPPPDDARK